MLLFARVLIGLVAALHLYFLILEMFLWKRPLGRKVFKTTPEQAEATATLAANQGLYNGFLSAGLIWAICASADMWRSLATFFLGCVIAAGAFGAMTVSPRILFVQAAPALLALIMTWLA
jgi:putative membrane protein